jgi:hypothetical protein
MARVDLYRNVHVGQRARLFGLAVALGAADVVERGVLADLTERCLAMIDELREHADHEDTFIHPLLRERAPEAADALDAEHVGLDAVLAALGHRARILPTVSADALPAAQHDLYLAVNELISAYLAHLHAEETVAMPALWERCTDDEVGAVFDAFRASRTAEESLADLRRMLPFLPPGTRATIARAVLDGSPAEQADRILDAVSATLSPGQRTRLREDLAGPRAR